MTRADLVDQYDAGRLEPVDAHQATCADCRQALRTVATVDQAMGLLRATTGPVPAGLVDQVMRRVRQTRRDESLIEVPASARAGQFLVGGGVRVRRQVVADIARAAATTLRGVTVARAAAQPTPGAPGTVEITMGLLVDGRTPLPELALRVQRAVRAAVQRAIGPTEVQVELTALDLLDQD
ncbi:hypothetical protein BH24ACT10_BH24ACT10_16750 [soil metagenome]